MHRGAKNKNDFRCRLRHLKKSKKILFRKKRYIVLISLGFKDLLLLKKDFSFQYSLVKIKSS